MERKNSSILCGLFSFLVITLILSIAPPASAGMTGDCSTHSFYVAPTSVPAIVSDPNPVISPCPDGSLSTTPPTFNLDCDSDGLCTINVPNFVDTLEMKDIAIDFRFTNGDAASLHGDTLGVSVECFDPVNNFAGIPGVIHEQGVFPNEDTGPTVYIFDVWCEPNPNYEEIVFQLPIVAVGEAEGNGIEILPVLVSIDVWTESFDNPPVGGTFVPIDQSALLLAGVQSVSMWMIPVVLAGIGIGIFVIKRRN